MLTSSLGPLDTVLPAVAAAPARTGGARPAAQHDFASAMDGAEKAHEDGGAGRSTTSAASTSHDETGNTKKHSRAADTASANTADDESTKEQSAKPMHAANAGWMLRSLRRDAGSGAAATTAKTSGKNANDDTTSLADSTDVDGTDENAAPIIVIAPELAQTPRPIPALELQGAATSTDGDSDHDACTGTAAVAAAGNADAAKQSQSTAPTPLPAAPTETIATAQADSLQMSADAAPNGAAQRRAASEHFHALRNRAAATIETAIEIAASQPVQTVESDTASRTSDANPAAAMLRSVEPLLDNSNIASDVKKAAQSAVAAAPTPHAISAAVAAAEKSSSAPKINAAAAIGEATLAKLDRTTLAPRTLAPVAAAIHTAPTLISAAAAGSETASIAAENFESEISGQIVQSLRMQWEQGGGEATLELNPNFLGRVQVSVKVEHGAVTASVQAAAPIVREWIASHRDDLTHTLSQQGLRLDKLEIAEAAKDQPARDSARDNRQAQRDAPRQRRDHNTDTTDTFELQEQQETV